VRIRRGRARAAQDVTRSPPPPPRMACLSLRGLRHALLRPSELDGAPRRL